MDHLSEVVDSRLKILLSDYYEFERLLKKLPSDMSEEMKNSISALEEALKVAPEFFDQNFKETMNQAMELAKNIENQVQEFNEFVKGQQRNLNQHANTITELHKRELDAMKSEHQKAMRVYTAEQKQLLEHAVEEATSRSDKSVKRAEAACNDIIKKFEDHCVVPISWLAILPLGGGVVGAVITLLALLVTRFFY